jgi:hypothetical protein
MKFQQQGMNLLNVTADIRPTVTLLNQVAQFLSSFTNNGTSMLENSKYEIKTVTLKDGVLQSVNHNGRLPPIAVICLDGRIEWIKTTKKETNSIEIYGRTMKVVCTVNNQRSQILNFSGCRYFKKNDTVSCGGYRAKVSNATESSMTLEKAIPLLEPELGLYEEQVTLLILW